MRLRHVLYGCVVCLFLLITIASVPSLFPDQSIQSYQDCMNKNNPTVNYFPAQCKAPDGRVFVKTDGSCYTPWECGQGYSCVQRKCRKN